MKPTPGKPFATGGSSSAAKRFSRCRTETGRAAGSMRSYREAVILPSAFGGIVTATIVGVARAAGETAPILFTSSIFANAVVTDPSQPMASMPFAIFTNSESPSHHDQEVAWAAALLLMAFVLLGSIASGKYVDVLLEVFGSRLCFPAEFAGRGDMSRGGLMLRCVASGEELGYVPLVGAERHGKRPPKLTR